MKYTDGTPFLGFLREFSDYRYTVIIDGDIEIRLRTDERIYTDHHLIQSHPVRTIIELSPELSTRLKDYKLGMYINIESLGYLINRGTEYLNIDLMRHVPSDYELVMHFRDLQVPLEGTRVRAVPMAIIGWLGHCLKTDFEDIMVHEQLSFYVPIRP